MRLDVSKGNGHVECGEGGNAFGHNEVVMVGGWLMGEAMVERWRLCGCSGGGYDDGHCLDGGWWKWWWKRW